MADLVVITPSRGRPGQLAELARAVHDTTDGRVYVAGLVDDDDPHRAEYKDLLDVWTGPRKSLAGWTNYAATVLLDQPAGERPRYLASLGDDHLPRTRDWDLVLIGAIEAMPGPGIAYGNDLYQGANLPTAWVVAAEVVDALDWMMLPTCEHMYVDTAVLELGRAADRIAYVPEVVIEHRHPLAGKAAWDASYRETNAAARYERDQAAYENWVANGGLATDVATLGRLHYSRTGG
jgi:hypothetical protein